MKAIKIPCEHDLLSSNSAVWADAVMRCKTSNPYCGADGFCHASGECFADQELTREQAILEVDRLAQELHSSKRENNLLGASAENLIKQLELAIKQNIEKGKSERVFAIRYCVAEIKKNLRGASDQYINR